MVQKTVGTMNGAGTKGSVGSTDCFSGKSQAVQCCAHTTQPVPSLLESELGRSNYWLPGTAATPARLWPPCVQ